MKSKSGTSLDVLCLLSVICAQLHWRFSKYKVMHLGLNRTHTCALLKLLSFYAASVQNWSRSHWSWWWNLEMRRAFQLMEGGETLKALPVRPSCFFMWPQLTITIVWSWTWPQIIILIAWSINRNGDWSFKCHGDCFCTFVRDLAVFPGRALQGIWNKQSRYLSIEIKRFKIALWKGNNFFSYYIHACI